MKTQHFRSQPIRWESHEDKIFPNRQLNNFPSVKQVNSNFFQLLATIDILQSFKADKEWKIFPKNKLLYEIHVMRTQNFHSQAAHSMRITFVQKNFPSSQPKTALRLLVLNWQQQEFWVLSTWTIKEWKIFWKTRLLYEIHVMNSTFSFVAHLMRITCLFRNTFSFSQ